MSLLESSTILLGAALVAVPLFKRLGLGSVLGYLAAGIALGPTGFAVVGHPEELLHFSELGVVLLLFLIGLELDPARLWAMRNTVFGLGAAQVIGTAVAIGARNDPPSPTPSAEGSMPADIAIEVITMGRARLWPASITAVKRSMP